MRLEGKVALITGGGSGIGRATAILFADEGARIVVSDVSETTAIGTVKEIKANGSAATITLGDVSRASDAERIVQTAVGAYGRLDVLVNSAGVSGRNALPEGATPEAVWDRVMDVNSKGTYLLSWPLKSSSVQMRPLNF